MKKRYKLERFQKNILLGVSGVTLASTMFFGGAQVNTKENTNPDTKIHTISELKTLNKLEKAEIKLQKKNLKKEKEV